MAIRLREDQQEVARRRSRRGAPDGLAAEVAAALESEPGGKVQSDMAGSFGFESEHYELSMQIGGMRLFGALEAEGSETLVAATGVPCRQQIAREAQHPVEPFRRALAP